MFAGADDAPGAFLSDLRAVKDYADIRCPPMISRYCSFCGWNKKNSFDTLLQNMLFMIYSLTFLVTFFIWTDDADCKTSSATSSVWHTSHKSAIVDVFQFSIQTQQIDTRAYTYVALQLFSETVLFQFHVSIRCGADDTKR